MGQVQKAAEAYGGASVMVCSFTRAAAFEIGSRVDQIPKQNIGTLHSICYRALDCPELTEGNERNFNERHPNLALSVGHKRSKTEAGGEQHMDEAGGETIGDSLRAEIDLLRVRRVPVDKWPQRLNLFHERWTQWKNDGGFMDFNDLLETCLRDFETAPGNPAAIFFDEAQDASQLQASLLAQWGKNTRRLILAGDDDQAIFYWAGADADSFLDFPCQQQNKRHLDQSYRIPNAVHEKSLAWIKQLDRREEKKYLPRTEEGFVANFAAQWNRPEEAVDAAEKFAESGKTVMMIASCSYMLEPLKSVLKARGTPFHNPWRRRRGDWNPLLSGGNERTMPVDRLRAFLRPCAAAWDEFGSGFWQYRDVSAWVSPMESKRSLIRGAKERLKEWKHENMELDPPAMAFILNEKLLKEWLDVDFKTHEQSVQSVRWWLDNLPEKESDKLAFPAKVFEKYGGIALREEPRITIGTGHSLKGAEADIVFVFPDLSNAAFEGWTQGGSEKDGIIRLFYVMMTRAREGLFLCSPASQKKVALAA